MNKLTLFKKKKMKYVQENPPMTEVGRNITM